MSAITDMHDALTGADLTAYLSGQHEGDCTAPYVYLTDAGITPVGKTVGVRTFYATACVPVGAPLKLIETVGAAKRALSNVGSVRATGDVSPEGIDDERNCRYASIEYQALCSLI